MLLNEYVDPVIHIVLYILDRKHECRLRKRLDLRNTSRVPSGPVLPQSHPEDALDEQPGAASDAFLQCLKIQESKISLLVNRIYFSLAEPLQALLNGILPVIFRQRCVPLILDRNVNGILRRRW